MEPSSPMAMAPFQTLEQSGMGGGGGTWLQRENDEEEEEEKEDMYLRSASVP